mgnify:CR=1 FL=1|tara:strand:- start:351 stop:662 length:312 start_codon:yes stop_codon:yes gene_type:complete
MINTQVKLSIKSEINTTTFTYGIVERDRKLLRLMSLLVIYRDEFTFDDAVDMLSKGNKEPQHLELLILSLNDNIEYHMDEEYNQHKDNPQALIDEASNNIEDV